MKFEYIKCSLKEISPTTGLKTHLRPVIPIKIQSENGGAVGYYALIDSGADHCIFHGEIGELIGIDVRSGEQQRFFGVQEGAGCIGYAHTICLVIGGHEVPARVCFSYDISENGSGILGQYGLFDSFKVTFNLNKETIEINQI